MHNNIMAAGSKDRPPMLGPGRYSQWRSHFLRYIDTKPNGEGLRKSILSGPYVPSTVLVQVVAATEGNPAIQQHTTIETVLNMTPENKEHFLSEKEAIFLLLTSIGDDIYSTVDACKIANEIWIAIERHKGKEIAKSVTPQSVVQFLMKDRDPVKAQWDKDMQKNLALLAKYFKKLYKPYNIKLRTSSTLGNKNVVPHSQVVQQNGIQCFNCKGFGHYAKECRKPKRVKDYTYHKEKMMMCKQAEQGVPLQAEQADWLADTDEEIDEQELEAHYSFMAKIQEVLPEESSSTEQPLEQVQNHDENNVFANERRHSEQPESINDTYVLEKDDSNVTPDSSNICNNDNQVDQNATECDDERVALANLIANLTLDTEENKTILKQLKKANASLTQELEKCKTNLDETSRALGEATSCRDSCLIALQNKQNELEKYIAFNDRTIDYDILQTKLNETLGLLARQLKEKSKVILDLKVKEEKDIDKMIEMDKQLKFLNEIVYTRNQSIQTIHMLAPKCSTYNGRPTFANPREIVDQAWFKHTTDYFRVPTAKDMEVLIKTLLMLLSIKTQNNSFRFEHELKTEMHEDYEYVKSLEKEVDKLESEKANFSNIYDILLEECVSKDGYIFIFALLWSHLNANTELQCLYLHKVKECECLAQKLSKQTESVNKEVHNKLLKSFAKLENHSISLELALNNVKNNENSTQFAKKTDQMYFEKNVNNIMKYGCERKSVETQFDKPSVVRQPNAQRIPKPSVLGKPTPFSNSPEMRSFQTKQSVNKTNVSDGLFKQVTQQNLPQNRKQAEIHSNVLKPGMYRIATTTTQNREPQLPHASRNTNPHVSKSSGVNHTTSVSRPQLKCYQVKDKVVPNNSQVKFKKKEVEDHHRISSISKKTKSVTACNDSSKSRTSNVNDVCAECGKCVFNSNHDACVSRYMNNVNARTKKPNVVSISVSKPKRKTNKSIATPHKKTVASDTTIQKSKSYYKELYENTNQEWKWWIAKKCLSGYKWTQKPYRTKKIWMPKIRKKDVSTTISLTIDIYSRITNIVQLILFIVDSGYTMHMTGNLKLLCNFVEKFLGTVHFVNDQFSPILGYGDLNQGNVTIKRVYYVKGLNHNLFSVGQFCDADLEVAFRKSTYFLHQPKEWLWHRRLSHLNFDYITLLSKKDIVTGLPKLKYVKDQLCSSCEMSKAKRSSFKSKAVPSSKGRLNLLHMDLCVTLGLFVYDPRMKRQAEENNNDQAPNASFQEDKFINPFCTRVQETGEPSSRNIDNTDVHSFQPQSHDYRWTRDHPLEQVRGNPTMLVQTRQQLATDPEMCMFALTVSIVEPKNIKEAMADSAWIEAMQDKLHQFDRLKVWELVDKPFGKMIIKLNSG
ncbi:retrovirus-related pol polyprotein from transposon TNT 1-94 [Tanacetum coccineum]